MSSIPKSIQMSFIEAQIEDTLEHHREILLARAYHNGIQPIYLTDRQKEYLDLHADNQFCLNVCRLVTTALCDELNVVGFDTGEKAGEDGVKKQAQWFWDVWNQNNMDALQSDIHERAVSESESFIILDWDKEKKIPSMIFHEHFTDVDAQAWEGRWTGLRSETMEWMQGTGEGVWIIYENEDPNQPAKVAIQQWTQITYDEKGEMDSERRRTFYYPDRIERFVFRDGEWEEFQPVQKWVDKQGKPLGIPVIHFKNKELRPEAWDAIPLNDAVNKTWVDILGTADLSGFPLFFMLGLYPTTDGKPPAEDNSNVWKVGPAQMLGNASVKSGEASVTKIEGSDPTPLMETLKDQIMFVAQITGTPASRFITTAQVAAADTLKEQERQLRKRAYNRQILFGNAWENAMIMARKLNNFFGTEELDETVTVEAVWKNISSIDDLIAEQGLGISDETLWAKAGYTQEQIKANKETQQYKIALQTKLWEGAALATQNIPLETYLILCGVPEEQRKIITDAIANQGAVPPTGL